MRTVAVCVALLFIAAPVRSEDAPTGWELKTDEKDKWGAVVRVFSRPASNDVLSEKHVIVVVNGRDADSAKTAVEECLRILRQRHPDSHRMMSPLNNRKLVWVITQGDIPSKLSDNAVLRARGEIADSHVTMVAWLKGPSLIDQ